MEVVKIGVQLKFDQNTEFYKEFVKLKKDQKQLASFIVRMLEAYYNNENVKQAVDGYMDDGSMLAQMSDILNNISLNHQKNIASLSGIKYTVDGAVDTLNRGMSDTANVQKVSTSQNANNSELNEEVNAKLNDLENKINLVLATLTGSTVPIIQLAPTESIVSTKVVDTTSKQVSEEDIPLWEDETSSKNKDIVEKVEVKGLEVTTRSIEEEQKPVLKELPIEKKEVKIKKEEKIEVKKEVESQKSIEGSKAFNTLINSISF
ncbi:hypothetical protein D3C81_11000 [compost metagenome]